MRAALLLIPALLLAACEDGRDVSEANTSNVARISIRNEHHEALLRLEPLMQRLGILRAIRQTGHRCRRVDNTGYQEEYRNMRMWVADCGNEQKQWAVFIAANGDVQVRDCAEAGQLGLPRCEALPPAVAVPEIGNAQVDSGLGNAVRPVRPPLGNTLR